MYGTLLCIVNPGTTACGPQTPHDATLCTCSKHPPPAVPDHDCRELLHPSRAASPVQFSQGADASAVDQCLTQQPPSPFFCCHDPSFGPLTGCSFASQIFVFQLTAPSTFMTPYRTNTDTPHPRPPCARRPPQTGFSTSRHPDARRVRQRRPSDIKALAGFSSLEVRGEAGPDSEDGRRKCV